MKGTVLILGATSPIARAVASAFARRGHALHLGARNQEELERTASDLRVREGGEVRTSLFDATRTDEHGAFLADVVAQAGGELDGVVVAFGLLGDADGRFTIDQNSGQIRVANGTALDFETNPSHSVTVRVTDRGGLVYDESFTITVQDLPQGENNPPTAIALDSQSVDENVAGVVIGQLSVSDLDAGDSHDFAVDDVRFDIAGVQLKLKDGISLDHETEDHVTLTVTATDRGGLATSQVFSIPVLDVNEPPTDILFGTDIDENTANGTLVKVAVAVDPDEGDSFTYELVGNAGGRFAIDSETGEVTVAQGAALDHEAAASHGITIRVTDSGGETYQETFTIHVNDVNEASTDVTLDNSTIDEGAAGGTVVGSLSATDPDTGDSFTYSLTDDAGGLFSIDGNELKVADGATLDFESAQYHDVTVQVTDAGGNNYSEVISLNVNDVPGQTINGTAGDDTLLGTSEDDILDGGDGDDTLQGGSGDDTLHGGAGNDNFLFHEDDGFDSADGGAGGGWTDTVQLMDANGGGDIGTFGSDWTLTLTEGAVTSQVANSITLSDDADGVITLADGSEFLFENFEVIVW